MLGKTFMKLYRSILSLFLAAIAVFLVSCGGPQVAKGPVYTPEQLVQIEKYVADVEAMRDSLLAIPPLVQQQKWVDVQSYIHGPLGEMRERMFRLARSLEPKVRKEAVQASREVFEHLIAIDEATETRDVPKALKNYNETLKDFEAFLKFVPAELS
jgi:photosystem II protein PsbQ